MATRTHSPIRHRPHRRAAPRINPEVLAALARRLTPRDHQILELVWEHRVLTTHQITAILFTQPRTARDRLLQLHRFAALDRFQPWTPTGTAPFHWVLGPAGAHVLAERRGIDTAQLGYRRTSALAIAHSTRLAHQIGINEFFAHLHAYARRHGDASAVAHWWPERRCAALWGDLARPDAYGRWAEPAAGTAKPTGDPCGFDFFLEHDTGSETLQRVAGKLAGYAALAESTGINTPVLFWLPSRAREINLRKVLGTPQVPVSTAVHTPGTDPQGPAGPVWLPAGTTGPRLRLAQLAELWPVTGTTTAGPEEHDDQDHAREDRADDQGHQDRTQDRPEPPQNHQTSARDRREPYEDGPRNAGHDDRQR